MNVSDEAVMRELARMALEAAFQSCSEKAAEAAQECPDGMSGRDALMAFSAAILSTNAKTWSPKGHG